MFKALTIALTTHRSKSLRSHAFVHPAFEQCYVLVWPRPIARHAAVLEGRVDLPGPGLDLGVGRQVETIVLHGVHIGRIAKQRSNIRGVAYSHRSPPFGTTAVGAGLAPPGAQPAAPRKRYCRPP